MTNSLQLYQTKLTILHYSVDNIVTQFLLCGSKQTACDPLGGRIGCGWLLNGGHASLLFVLLSW